VHVLLVHQLARPVRGVFAAGPGPLGGPSLAGAADLRLGCGLPAAAGLSGLLSIRRRPGCCENCCCDCGEDCCCECSCDCCGDACCGSCDCNC
jgi:hypothetical protein